MDENLKILVVDDEAAHCDVLAMVLQAEGYHVTQCIRAKEVLELLKSEDFDLIVSDLIMPEMDGIALLKAVKAVRPDMNFIILTAYGTIENAVKAMKQGAFTYVIKGSDPEDLLREIQNIKKLSQIQNKEASQSDSLSGEYMLNTKSRVFADVLNIAAKAAKSDANILLLGESGSGKEVIAQYIHRGSNRSKNHFYATNCHTFSDSLLESELFGHEKGSFTGAASTRIGRFEAAEAGSLFLDEIGDVPPSTQAKLLRAIETKTVNRIGSNTDIKVDFRLISATNKDLEKEIKEGRFREDLFYRLSTIIIQIPPLRQRKEDLPELIRYFLNKVRISLGLEKITMDDEVSSFLMRYHYPGNIRELKNMIERMAVLSDDGKISADSISNLVYRSESGELEELFEGNRSLKDIRRGVESKYIQNALKKNLFNITKTAKELDISTRHLFNKISEYGIKEHPDRTGSSNEE